MTEPKIVKIVNSQSSCWYQAKYEPEWRRCAYLPPDQTSCQLQGSPNVKCHEVRGGAVVDYIYLHEGALELAALKGEI